MGNILTEDVIPNIKSKINNLQPKLVSGTNIKTINGSPVLGSGNMITSYFKVYEPAASDISNGVISINDSSISGVPLNGYYFILRPQVNVTNPQISFNGGTAWGIGVQHTENSAAPRPDLAIMQSYNNYLICRVGNWWRAINMTAPIAYNDLDTPLQSYINTQNKILKFYDNVTNTNGTINISDSSINTGTSYPAGLHFMLRSQVDVDDVKINFNGLGAKEVYATHIGNSGWNRVTHFRNWDIWEVAFADGVWRLLNKPAPLAYTDCNADLQRLIDVTKVLHNVQVTNDTPDGWCAKFDTGKQIVYYDTAECFASQPNKYGFLEVNVYGTHECSLVWHQQGMANIKVRAGNASGWSTDWRDVIDTGSSGLVSNSMIASNSIARDKLSNAVSSNTYSIVPTDKNIIRMGNRKIMWGHESISVPAAGSVSTTITFPESFFTSSPNVQLTSRTIVHSNLNVTSLASDKFTLNISSDHGAQYNQAYSWLAIG